MGLKWFKHDTNANQDGKMQNVLLDYGLEGYGLYWYCIEIIANKVDKDNIKFDLEHDARIIARNTGSTVQKVEEMMRYFVSIDLFEDCEGKITCLKLAKRLDKSMTSNPQMRELIQNFRSHDKVMINSDEVMLDKTKLDKTKLDKTKLKEKIKPEVWHAEQRELISSAYNLVIANTSKSKFTRWTDKRIAKLKTRTGEAVERDIDWWLGVINSIPNHAMAMQSDWFTIDFILESDDRLIKFLEGKYKKALRSNQISDEDRKRKVIQDALALTNSGVISEQ